jgi:hypothetical protein
MFAGRSKSMSTTETNGTTNGKTNGKTERLGIVPVEKINTVVGAKVWAEHRKNLAALAAAKAAAAVSKAAVQAALAKSLKLGEPETLNFWADADKMVVARRPTEKKPRQTALRDLTAA